MEPSRIASRDDLRRFIAADVRAYGLRRLNLVAWLRYPQLRFQVLLRLTEYVVACHRDPLGRAAGGFLRWQLVARGSRIGLTIPVNVFGPGLCIVHYGTLVVSGEARVGARCRIHPSTTIGVAQGGAPVLGDDVYVGPGARIFGPITIADGVRVGANAVVNRSIEEPGVAVGGVPARLL